MKARLVKRSDGFWERQLAHNNQSFANAIRKTHNRRVYSCTNTVTVHDVFKRAARRQNWTIVEG